jgi:carbamoyltransferase
MSYVVPTDAAKVPAVTHVDGTSRPQIVGAQDDPFILRLLTAWHEKTGCELMLNTSFNCREPLVDTIEHARATWKRTELDVLVTPQGIEQDKTGPYALQPEADRVNRALCVSSG